jgi:hypothetical protein
MDKNRKMLNIIPKNRVKSLFAVLSAAHCFPKRVKMSKKYYKVEPNSYYPTLESMVSVYLGLHNIKYLNDSSSNLVNVSHLLIVSIFYFLNDFNFLLKILKIFYDSCSVFLRILPFILFY